MKIMQINVVYPAGSTGRITSMLHHAALDSGYESVVCYGRQQACSEPGIYKICSELYGKLNRLAAMATGFMYGGCLLSTEKLERIIEKEDPDIVHLQCINGNFVNVYRLIEFLKKRKQKTVLTLHAEFMYTGNCPHAGACEKWLSGCGSCPRLKQETDSLFFDRTRQSHERLRRAYEGFDTLSVVGVSDWITRRAKMSGMFGGRPIRTIRNGIDTDVFYSDDSGDIRGRFGIGDRKKLILFVTPQWNSLKGADAFIRLAERLKEKDYAFLAVGTERPADYHGEIVFAGKVADPAELRRIYSASDLLTVLSRFDTYPTVCLEAAACATPVVGYDVGGVAEAIATGVGATVPYGDADTLEKAVIRYAGRSACADRLNDPAVRANLSRERMCAEYLSLYEELR